jgi:hypothetical protein
MLLEEDVAMKKPEETRPPPRPAGETPQPAPIRQDDTDHQAADDLPLLPISPPPMPWPRVFPSL